MATKSLPHNSPSQLRTAIYAWVSTNNGQDPEVQLRELREIHPPQQVLEAGRVRSGRFF